MFISIKKTSAEINFLVLDTYHPDICIYVSKYDDTWLFFEAKRGPRTTKFRKRFVCQLIQMWSRCCVYVHQGMGWEGDGKEYPYGPVLCPTP
jgi:hypothetical protein